LFAEVLVVFTDASLDKLAREPKILKDLLLAE